VFIVLGILGLLLLGYAGGLLLAVRRGRPVGRWGYLILLGINVAVIAVVVAWFATSGPTG
jgi:hypothetical protein